MIPKFRTWNSETKEIEVFKTYEEISELFLALSADDGFYSIMQSTGLCDKEGTEVFEGDILHHQIQTEYTFIVKYDKDKGRWYGDGLSRTYRIDIAKRFLPYYYKVIGNIYENPELLEVKP